MNIRPVASVLILNLLAFGCGPGLNLSGQQVTECRLPVGDAVTYGPGNAGSYSNIPALSITLNLPITMEAWVSVSGAPTSQPIVAALWAGPWRMGFDLTATNYISAYAPNSGCSGIAAGKSSASALALGTPTHIAAVVDSTSITLFINGISQGSSAAPYGSACTAGAFMSGTNTGLGAWLNGTVDSVRFTQGKKYTSNFTPLRGGFCTDASTVFLWNMDSWMTTIPSLAVGANGGQISMGASPF